MSEGKFEAVERGGSTRRPTRTTSLSFGVLPVFHWRGARPFPLDLDEAASGSAAWLVLGREDDICLLLLGWDRNSGHDERGGLSCLAGTPDAGTLRRAVGDLAGDGWVVIGRVDARFTGQYSGDEAVYSDS